jgi:ankyrin repeat protein
MKRISILLVCLCFATSGRGGFDDSLQEIDNLLRLRDYAGAVVQLKLLADEGSAEAQYRLAGMYRTGKGVPRDLDKAHENYLRAARNGHAQAQFALGVLIEKSHTPDAVMDARAWYQKAASQGHEGASEKLAQADRIASPGTHDVTPQTVFAAIQHNDEAYIESLISNGVNLDLTDAQGNSTVMAALLAGWPQLAAKLINHSKINGQPNAQGITPLHLAGRFGYRDIVVALLAQAVDIDQTDARGNTALMLAVKNGHVAIAGLLLDRGANYRIQNDRKQMATDLAYADHNSKIGELFSRHGIPPRNKAQPASSQSLARFKSSVSEHGVRYRGWPLLNVAIELGEISIIDQILAQLPGSLATDPQGNSALQVAARKADADTLRKLVARGASVNAVNARGETALYLAVEAKCLPCIRHLLDHKADVSIATRLAITPLEVALQTGQDRIAWQLLDNSMRYAGIHRALLLAIRKRQEKLAIALVARDDRLATVDSSGRSVLWHAADQGLDDLAASLVSSGQIDLDQRDINGRNAVSQAIVHGRIEIVRLLVDHGAALDTRTEEGNSPLMLAVLAKSPEIVDLLLANKVDINARNKLGHTALMLAAASAQNGLVRRLITAGADLQLRNRDDMDAFQIATESGHPDTAAIIHDSSNLIFRLFN